MKSYTAADFKTKYEEMTSACNVTLTFESELVGGVSTDEAGVKAFVSHHLKLVGDEAEKAVARIMSDEVNLTPEAAELEEKLTYGLYIVRRDESGPWLGDWMIKACLKAAASRTGLFVARRGSKGDVAEMGSVVALGNSLCFGESRKVHIWRDTPDGVVVAPSYYREFKGRVNTPQGSMSIVSHRECIAPGAQISFHFRWYTGKITEDDVLKMFAAAQNIGLGSAKNYESGKFRIDSLDMLD